MTFEEKIKTYAELIVRHGLNVQPGQIVNIGGEMAHRDLAVAVVEAAYAVGAKHVSVTLSEPRSHRLRIENGSDEDLQFVPNSIPAMSEQILDEAGANLALVGLEFPDLMADCNAKRMNLSRQASYLARKSFYVEGIGQSKVHWCVAGGATQNWAARVFPDAPAEEQLSLLWDAIFATCRVDSPDCLEQWKEHNRKLKARAGALNDLNIQELHFTGPGTDLIVGISDKASFMGGGSMGPYGVEFEPNLPTEEVFTTPNYHLTRGKVRTTRPFYINGVLIDGLEIEFRDGAVADFTAKSGADTFREYIDSDPGARRLGEVALVGIDSPIFQSGLVFQEILYDENAACHIAVGSAYKFCITDSADMTPEQLEEIGCNESSAHTDMMISSEEVDVTAKTYGGDLVPLMKSGEWVVG